MSPSPGLSYLEQVVLEIIETERVYVKDLRMIVQDYLGHIIDHPELGIQPEQVCALFGNIEDIYEFNSELLQDLEQCRHDPVEVAQCFVLKREHFDIYTLYCNNYPRSVRVLTELMSDKTLALFFHHHQQILKTPLPLGSYLLKPVQRVLKYRLLLQEIQSHWDPSDDGADIVDEALVSMTTVAWFINEMKRRHESSVRVQEVQSLLLNWKGPDLTMFGDLVLEGTFKMSQVKSQRNVFLFQKVLLLTKKRGENYVYKNHITCSTLMLIENARDSQSFSVTHYKRPKQPITLQARSVEEKQLWAQHIKRIILENHQELMPPKDTVTEQIPINQLRKGHEEQLRASFYKHVRRESTRRGPTKRTATETRVTPAQDEDQKQSLNQELHLHQELVDPPSTDPHSDLHHNQELNQDLYCRALSSETESEEDLLSEPAMDHTQFRIPISPRVCKPPELDLQNWSTVQESDVQTQRKSISWNSPTPGRLSWTRSPRLTPDQGLTPHQQDLASGLDPDLDEDSVFDSMRKRRDSSLSLKDQLLMEKIRTFYETQVQTDYRTKSRRDSLDYIPPGLVQTSVCRINSERPLTGSTETRSSQESLKTEHFQTSEALDSDQWKSVPTSAEIDLNQELGPDPNLRLNQDLTQTQPCQGSTVREEIHSGSEQDFSTSSEMICTWKDLDQQNQTRTKGRIRPRASSYSCEADDEDDQTQSKVQVLARRYSQHVTPRIRTRTRTPRTTSHHLSRQNLVQSVVSEENSFDESHMSAKKKGGASEHESDWPDVQQLKCKYSPQYKSEDVLNDPNTQDLAEVHSLNQDLDLEQIENLKETSEEQKNIQETAQNQEKTHPINSNQISEREQEAPDKKESGLGLDLKTDFVLKQEKSPDTVKKSTDFGQTNKDTEHRRTVKEVTLTFESHSASEHSQRKARRNLSIDVLTAEAIPIQEKSPNLKTQTDSKKPLVSDVRNKFEAKLTKADPKIHNLEIAMKSTAKRSSKSENVCKETDLFPKEDTGLTTLVKNHDTEGLIRPNLQSELELKTDLKLNQDLRAQHELVSENSRRHSGSKGPSVDDIIKRFAPKASPVSQKESFSLMKTRSELNIGSAPEQKPDTEVKCKLRTEKSPENDCEAKKSCQSANISEDKLKFIKRTQTFNIPQNTEKKITDDKSKTLESGTKGELASNKWKNWNFVPEEKTKSISKCRTQSVSDSELDSHGNNGDFPSTKQKSFFITAKEKFKLNHLKSCKSAINIINVASEEKLDQKPDSKTSFDSEPQYGRLKMSEFVQDRFKTKEMVCLNKATGTNGSKAEAKSLQETDLNPNQDLTSEAKMEKLEWVKEHIKRGPICAPLPDPDLEGDLGLVQIRSPTSREKICVWAVSERCRLYQKQTELKKEARDLESKEQNQDQKQGHNQTAPDQNRVKTLRQRFQD